MQSIPTQSTISVNVPVPILNVDTVIAAEEEAAQVWDTTKSDNDNSHYSTEEEGDELPFGLYVNSQEREKITSQHNKATINGFKRENETQHGPMLQPTFLKKLLIHIFKQPLILSRIYKSQLI